MNKTFKIQTCPTCGSRKIKKIRRNHTGKFSGQSYSVSSLERYECPECGEKIYDREAMRQIERVSPAFSKVRNRKIAFG
jgi:YgiT-type zinc finger domain-containing protein